MERMFGLCDEREQAMLSKHDKKIVDKLSGTAKSNDQIPAAFWPHVSGTAASEHVGMMLFALCFPLLCPGGIGDHNDSKASKSHTVKSQAEKLLHFEDGRFPSDKMWCFCVLNCCTRRCNQNLGGFFVAAMELHC